MSFIGAPSKRIFLFLAAIGLQGLAYAEGQIVAAADVGFPPYAMAKPTGGFEGINIDIAAALSKALGKKVVVIDQPWASTFAALSAKKVDMILAPMFLNKERAEQLLFSEANNNVTLRFVLRKNGSPVSAPADLKGKVIAINKGAGFERWLTALQPEMGWTINRYDKNTDAVQSVVSGQSDAALMNASTASYIAKQSAALKTSAYVHDEGIVYGYGFRKDDRATRDAVDLALKCMKRDGTLAAIYKKWTGEDPLPNGAMVKVSAGVGQPGLEGYDPSVPAPKCKTTR